MAQHDTILRYLKSGKTITGKISWRQFGIYRLSDVIFKLRKTHNIHCENIKVGEHRFGHYTYIGEKA